MPKIVAAKTIEKIRAAAISVSTRMGISGVLFQKLTSHPKTLLNIGCGTGESFDWIKKRDFSGKLAGTYCVGVDVFWQSAKEAKKVYHDTICCHSNHLPIKGNSFDVVISTEVIEHLNKKDGCGFLKNAEAVAKKQVFITTPVMSVDQPPSEWAINPFQQHLSAWHPQEMRTMGYTVIGLRGIKSLYGQSHQYGVDYKFRTCALKHFFDMLVKISQLAAYFFPSIALDQLCIKTVQSCR